ncbi:MAG: hypothetical protein LBG82_08165 [Clostridiales Family XIII bacterium]|jgi:hypothetical protein|nr:hypothetical protein [Clostridiales Family XIII bacterium]
MNQTNPANQSNPANQANQAHQANPASQANQANPVDHATPIEAIRRRHEEGSLPHAMLVSGGTSGSRREFAKDAAALLLGRGNGAPLTDDLGNMPDLIWVSPEGGSIKVGQIQDLVGRLRMKPFSSDRTLAVIEDGELMNAQSQNKLLKTLEEPPGDSVIIILAANTGLLRPTILSRCLKMDLGVRIAGIEQSVQDDAMSLLSGTLFGKPIFSAFKLLDGYVDDPFPLLDAMQLFLRDLVVGMHDPQLVADRSHRDIALKMKGRNPDALEAGIIIVEETRAVLRSASMNRKNCLRDMALRLGKR